MGRIHLFEFGDQGWFPHFLRQYETDYLRFIIEKMNGHKPLIPVLGQLLKSSGKKKIIDLGSGSGGGTGLLQKDLEADVGFPVHVTLTDIRPRPSVVETFSVKGQGPIDYREEPLNAKKIPAEMEGCFTMFNSFHHFKPDEAREILRSITQRNQPLAIIESMDNNYIQIPFQMVLIPVFVLIFTPFIRPFKWSRLLFTYLIPIMPLVITWDGIISVLRLYSPERMKKMGEEAGPEYEWKAGKTEGNPKQLYLTGVPVSGK